MTTNQKNQIYLTDFVNEIIKLIKYFQYDILKDTGLINQLSPLLFKIDKNYYSMKEIMDYLTHNATREEILSFKEYQSECDKKRLKLTTKQIQDQTFFNLDFQSWRSEVYKQ